MLETLYQESLKRKKEPKEGSYTSYLYDKGLDKNEMANETADLLYHLAVALVETGVSLEEVEAVLQARQGKQSRIHDRPEIDQY